MTLGAGITHWQSPYFFGYFPCNSSFPALLGDMLCSGLATQNFSWIGSPAATELEMVSGHTDHNISSCTATGSLTAGATCPSCRLEGAVQAS